MTQFKGKAIYNPSGKAGEYSYWACNFYVGCSNGCQYCYLKKGIGKAVLGGDKPTLKKCFRNDQHAIDVFFKELYDPATEAPKADIKKHGLFFTFSSDPCLPQTQTLNFAVIKTCLQLQVPIKILTKCTDWIDTEQGQQLLSNPNARQFLAVGFTLTGHDELEPNAASNAARIKAMKRIYDIGVKTFASIEPVIDCSSSYEMIAKTIGFCNLYKIGLQSGKIYKSKEIELFIESIGELEPQRPIYLKDSIFRYCNYPRETMEQTAGNYVGKDYNIFIR